MTTTDKTKDKLVDSMRKSKASGSANTTAKKTTAKSKTTTRSTATSKKPAAKKENISTDAFQSSGRVWPD